jgi:Right handed beta helix region
VRNFDIGVWAVNNAGDVRVSNVVVSGNSLEGVVVSGKAPVVTSSSAFGNGGIGIDISGAGASVKSSTASGNANTGINAVGSGASVVSSTAAGNAGTGIHVVGDLVQVRSSNAAGNVGDGVLVGVSTSGSVKSSTASGNGGRGIAVLTGATEALIKGNRAVGNGFAGGASDLNGLGIFAQGFAPASAGTNVARGNDDPAECTASLC